MILNSQVLLMYFNLNDKFQVLFLSLVEFIDDNILLYVDINIDH